MLFRFIISSVYLGSLVAQMVKRPPRNAEIRVSGLGRSPGERNGNPLQYSCLENSMDRGASCANRVSSVVLLNISI